jgi:hypothetical protein
MSPRWMSEKLCADAAGAPHSVSANKAEASRRSEGIGKSFWTGFQRRGVVKTVFRKLVYFKSVDF